jgi:hypothetical protein
VPTITDRGRFLGRGQHLAVLLLQLGHDVGDVHELGLVEPGEVHAHLDEIVPGLRLDLGGVLGRLLGRGDVVDLDFDARVLGEALADLGQLLVGGGREVVPAQVGDLALLPPRGRDARGQDAGESGAGAGDKPTASDRDHSSSTLSERSESIAAGPR